MPWQEVSIMDCRREFVMFASREGANISELCRRYGISRTSDWMPGSSPGMSRGLGRGLASLSTSVPGMSWSLAASTGEKFRYRPHLWSRRRVR